MNYEVGIGFRVWNNKEKIFEYFREFYIKIIEDLNGHRKTHVDGMDKEADYIQNIIEILNEITKGYMDSIIVTINDTVFYGFNGIKAFEEVMNGAFPNEILDKYKGDLYDKTNSFQKFKSIF